MKLYEYRVNRFIVFQGNIGAHNNPLCECIHAYNETTIFMKICSIEKHILILAIVRPYRWWLVEPVIFYSFQFRLTVTGKFAELANRKAFRDPEFKPGLFFLPRDIRPLPGKGFMTHMAIKTLNAGFGFPPKFYLWTTTEYAVFFYACWPLYQTGLIMWAKQYNKIKYLQMVSLILFLVQQHFLTFMPSMTKQEVRSNI